MIIKGFQDIKVLEFSYNVKLFVQRSDSKCLHLINKLNSEIALSPAPAQWYDMRGKSFVKSKLKLRLKTSYLVAKSFDVLISARLYPF